MRRRRDADGASDVLVRGGTTPEVRIRLRALIGAGTPVACCAASTTAGLHWGLTIGLAVSIPAFAASALVSVLTALAIHRQNMALIGLVRPGFPPRTSESGPGDETDVPPPGTTGTQTPRPVATWPASVPAQNRAAESETGDTNGAHGMMHAG